MLRKNDNDAGDFWFNVFSLALVLFGAAGIICILFGWEKPTVDQLVGHSFLYVALIIIGCLFRFANKMMEVRPSAVFVDPNKK